MFSACESSQISSIDSYAAVRDNGSGGDSVEDLMAEMSGSGDASTKSKESSAASSHSSIMDALSFSSDSDFASKETRRGHSQHSKIKLDMKTCAEPQPVTAPAEVPVKPRRTRSAMGTYIPPPGGRPLTRSLISYGPGPGAYMVTKECCPDKYQENHFSARFKDADSLGPGPAIYDIAKWTPVGKYKPKAVILSRTRERRIRSAVRWPNLYGYTRYGQPRAPSALLVSRPWTIPAPAPGPGAYDPDKCRDCRVGIQIRGRSANNYKIDPDIPGPKYGLPSSLKGPAWTILSRRDKLEMSASPGPIYKLPPEPKKPISLTFNPFPTKGRESDPAPNHYPNVAHQYINTKTAAPKAIIGDRTYPDFGLWQRPGPNRYYPPTPAEIGFSSYNECSMKGFRKHKISLQPGPADYKVPAIPPWIKRAPSATIPNTYRPPPPTDSGPGFKYSPKGDRGSVRNVFLSPRWPRRSLVTDDVPFYDLTGFTQRGKVNRIPVSLKARQSPFVYQGVPGTTSCRHQDTCNLISLKFEGAAKAGAETQSLRALAGSSS